MKYLKKIKTAIFIEVVCFVSLLLFNMNQLDKIFSFLDTYRTTIETVSTGDKFIKWVDFNVPCEALKCAYKWDIDTYGKEVHINWIELLAYAAAKNGGKFGKKSISEMNETAEQLTQKDTTIKELTKELKYYDYYLEAYQAVLGEYVGEYTVTASQEKASAKAQKRYGLKVFFPIAKQFEYNDYDDFGVSRSFGYERKHLGHDMMGQIGTPIICVESGYVEALGWNKYGGWRIGIRSFDKKRYYYYAHLRQNYPYQKSLKENATVQAGEVIGYMGHTGYSATENVNNIKTVHLHFGIQLIFDESQKDGNTEIWINPYQLCRFLYQNRASVEKVEGTKEWRSVIESD